MPQRPNFTKTNIPRTSILDDEPQIEKKNKEIDKQPVKDKEVIKTDLQQEDRSALKEMEPGKTLLATTQPKLDGHVTEVKIFFGNFVTPMMKDEKGNWEFKRLNNEKYRETLANFLDSPEGAEYKAPTEEEIKTADEIVLEKEKAYLKKLEASKKIEEQQINNQPPVNTKETNNESKAEKSVKIKEQKVEKIETDVEPADLKYVDDVLSYSEEQMEKYRKRGFTQPQLEQIEKGLKAEVDVTQYAFKDMSAGQMERQRKILQERQGLHNEAEDRFGQDYSDEKAETIEDKLEKLEEKEYSGLKALSSTIGVIVLSLLVVALCIVLVTILIKAFKIYSKGF